MALVSDILRRAYRESNLIPLGQDPNAAQIVEGLELLNTLVLSTVDNEVSDGLEEVVIGGDFDQMELLTDAYVPDNTRLVFNLEDGPIVMGLDPYPKDGQRFAIVDTSGNISTNTVTIDGNGRQIENASSVTLNTDYMNREWLYRADTGNWVVISALTEDSSMPFPTDFDDYFTIMLASRINPRYGQAIADDTRRMLQRARSQLNSRYNKTKEIYPDVDYRSVPSQRTGFNSFGGDFDTGTIYPWK